MTVSLLTRIQLIVHKKNMSSNKCQNTVDLNNYYQIQIKRKNNYTVNGIH